MTWPPKGFMMIGIPHERLGIKMAGLKTRPALH